MLKIKNILCSKKVNKFYYDPQVWTKDLPEDSQIKPKLVSILNEDGTTRFRKMDVGKLYCVDIRFAPDASLYKTISAYDYKDALKLARETVNNLNS